MDLPIYSPAASHSPSTSANSIISELSLPPSIIQRRPSTISDSASSGILTNGNNNNNNNVDEQFEPRVILLTGGAGFINEYCQSCDV